MVFLWEEFSSWGSLVCSGIMSVNMNDEYRLVNVSIVMIVYCGGVWERCFLVLLLFVFIGLGYWCF